LNVTVIEDSSIVFGGSRAIGFYFAHLTCECSGQVRYERKGSCCPQVSKYSFVDGIVLLDRYNVKCVKYRKKKIFYINIYDPGNKYAPVGYILNKE
jgi:hypothetical protein